MNCWGERSCRVSWGQAEVKLLRKAICLPNLVGRAPGQSVMYCCCQRPCRGQMGSTSGHIASKCPLITKFGKKNLWPKYGHWGQPEVKLLRNTLMGTKFDRKNPCVKCYAFLGSAIMATKCGRKNHWGSLLEVCRDQPRSNRCQVAKGL